MVKRLVIVEKDWFKSLFINIIFSEIWMLGFKMASKILFFWN